MYYISTTRLKKKAFDTVNHDILLKIKNHYGIREKLINFLLLV